MEKEISIKINNSNLINSQNKIVRVSFILMFVAFILQSAFFGIDVKNQYGYSGGLMASIFCLAYMLSAYLAIRRNPESTFISLLYLIAIYAVPCLWMGVYYILIDYTGIYDFIQLGTCLVALTLAILGISSYYKNNMKAASAFALISMIVSIIALLLGGTAEIVHLVQSSVKYLPLIGCGFFLEGICGILPLIYLFRTL